MASKNIMLDILLNTSDGLKQIALINVIITFNFNFFFDVLISFILFFNFALSWYKKSILSLILIV
mgnify:CR=1 FL=1